MLTSDLLRIRVRGGKVAPVYAGHEAVPLAEKVIAAYRGGVGKKKGEIRAETERLELEHDFKLVRGLSALLDRRCAFEADSPFEPGRARMLVFEEASRRGAVSPNERRETLEHVAKEAGLDAGSLEKALYADLEDELVLRSFAPVDAASLVPQYNLSLVQTLLFRSTGMEFTASGGWKEVFGAIRRLGLMYSVQEAEGRYRVSVDGPTSLMKMTERYGTSMAKLLPYVIRSEPWEVSASVLGRDRRRIYGFDLKSGEVELKDEAYVAQKAYDSSVEEKFATGFDRLKSGWTLVREPEPLIAGRYVLIPDFAFLKHGVKVYLEIVGFWTAEYLAKKASKLASLEGVDILVAVNESLACSKFDRLKGPVIYYRKEVPTKPILEYLREKERAALRAEVGGLAGRDIALHGDVVTLLRISEEQGVPVEAVKEALASRAFAGYVRVGGAFVSEARLREVQRGLEGVEDLSEALLKIERAGVTDGYDALGALGYEVEWGGLDRGRIRRRG